ncbi:MAG: histidinol-phosphatase [Geminicoccales bacterium]
MTDKPLPTEFVQLAFRLTMASRQAIQPYFRHPVTVDSKPDNSPVTAADRAAETAMRRLIAQQFPDHGIVGEEEGAHNAEAPFVWVLDPIDGTKRFITGNPLYGTLIALLEGGTPILGVIDMPALGERWLGMAERPTLFTDREGTREVKTRACPTLAEAALYSTSPFMFEGPNAPPYGRLTGAVKMPLYGGECYAYGLLASGFVDLVVEAEMKPYDYLSHVPVIEGAGGRITDWQGRKLGLESDGRILAAGDPRCHAAALELLSQ